MDFMTYLPILTNYKSKNYSLILVNVDPFIKIIHYELIKVNINIFSFTKLIINIGMYHFDLLTLIINHSGFIFNSNSGYLFVIFCKSSKSF